MKTIFDFDFTLGHMMDLSLHPYRKVQTLLTYLAKFWYTDKSGEIDKERWENVRIGNCKVYLDDGHHLHLDFQTRFNLKNPSTPLPQSLFEDDPPEDFLKQLAKTEKN